MIDNKKTAALFLSLVLALSAIACGNSAGAGSKDSGSGAGSLSSNKKTAYTMTVDSSAAHQTFDGFGTSSCWWSQYVGGWDNPYAEETETSDGKSAVSDSEASSEGSDMHEPISVSERVARWLYSRDEGIGLTIYRYNVGAGSKDSGLGDIPNPDRRAESFIGADGE
ncbi:MAG: hypothetical protein K6E32_08555, partial [Lachnospiraceae bacterium]|nr:hypothetical protein [Lachnospiraceae bacterium]